MVCGIKCAFDLHPNWVVLQIDMDNALNYVSKKVVFQELQVVGGETTQLVLLVFIFLCFESLLYSTQYICERVVTVIPLTMEIQLSK